MKKGTDIAHKYSPQSTTTAGTARGKQRDDHRWNTCKAGTGNKPGD